MTVKQLKQGEWFTRKPIAEPKASQVYIREEYDRSTGKYICTKWDDISKSILLKGTTEIYTDFIF